MLIIHYTYINLLLKKQLPGFHVCFFSSFIHYLQTPHDFLLILLIIISRCYSRQTHGNQWEFSPLLSANTTLFFPSSIFSSLLSQSVALVEIIRFIADSSDDIYRRHQKPQPPSYEPGPAFCLFLCHSLHQNQPQLSLAC